MVDVKNTKDFDQFDFMQAKSIVKDSELNIAEIVNNLLNKLK